MNGIIKSAAHDAADSRHERPTIKSKIFDARYLIGFVILPSLLVAGYYYLIASDQYLSSADFIVRRSDSPLRSSGSPGALLGFATGTSSASSEASLISDYLGSHSAVDRLRREGDLVKRFHRSDIDFLSRIRSPDPMPEALLKFYRKHITIEQNLETGISELRVKAFSPLDAQEIAETLLELGEQQVNKINERTMRDQLVFSQRELKSAEADLQLLQVQITAFRRAKGDIDPTGSGKAQIGLVSNLTAGLAEAKARANALKSLVSTSSPQYRFAAAQVRELEAQVASQNSRLTSGGRNIATSLGAYEDLLVRQDFAAKRYSGAAAAYQEARAQALKQQLYLVRVVDPNKPVKALFPERGRIVITVFFSLLMAYGILRLLVAGVKEHKL